jgi:chemotaxis methyl-accepting protein methylase
MNGFFSQTAFGACPIYPDVVALGREVRLQLKLPGEASTAEEILNRLDTLHGAGAFSGYVLSQPYLKQRSLDEQIGSFICFGIPSQTDWFRDRNAFRAFKFEILPSYTTLNRPMRIASIGCSTGMEVYSALLAANAPGRILELRGYDVNPSSLVVARQGIFPGRKLVPGNPWSILPIQFQDRQLVDPASVAQYVARYGILPSSVGDQSWFSLTAPPGVVTFVQHDIVTHPLDVPVDVAFLLKVRLHFPAATRCRILRNLRSSITEGGWVISDSEDALRQEVIDEFRQAGFSKVPVRAPGWWGGLEDISDTTTIYRPTKSCG